MTALVGHASARVMGRPRRSVAGRLLAMALLLVLVSPLPTLSAQLTTTTTSSSSSSSSPSAAGVTGSHYPDFALSLLDSGDRITLDSLDSLTGGQPSVTNLERAIQSDLLAYDVRQVLLDVGWQNFTAGRVPFQSWVANWLTACDALGVQNVLYVGPLTQEGVGSPWAESVIRMDPTSRTAFANGTLANYVSPDDPDVAKFVEVDLQSLYSYYGNYSSWVGIGTGYPDGSPYYSQDSSTIPVLGYSNSSLVAFTNSIYFRANMTNVGLDNATVNLLALAYQTVEPSISVASGVWMTSSPQSIYGGSPTTDHQVEMRFFIPANESELQIEWYGAATGNPGLLVGTIYPDDDGVISTGASLASSSESASAVSSSSSSPSMGWQPPLIFHHDFTKGYYWIVFSSPSSDASNFYDVYMRDYDIGNATSVYVLPSGQGSLFGSSILWVKDASGTDISVYPYQDELIPSATQTFTANSSFSFNTVFLFLSDRDYNPTNGTITVSDLTEGGTVLANGTLSQEMIHGTQNWTPISLDQNVTTVPGHQYSMSVTEPNDGYSWSVVLRGVTSDPPSAGFQNQTSYWLFQLGYVRWGPSATNYGVITSNGKDSVTDGELDGLRFVPASNETVSSVEVLMKNLETTATEYTQGNLTVGIWTSAPNGTQPLSPLRSITVPGTSVPTNSWLNVTGFALPVTAGHYYWMVFSSTSDTVFSLARLTSSYDSLVLASTDGGTSWGVPAEGPTDLSYGIFFLSGHAIGNFVQNLPQVELNQETDLAQPFTTTTQMQVKGVYLGVLSKQSSFGPTSGVVVSIHPDNGSGGPSDLSLATGVLSGNEMTYYSNEYVAFSSVARLQAGHTYWIEVQARDGIYYVYPVEYQRPPAGVASGESALISTDSGFGWERLSNLTTILSYEVASPEVPSPTYSTSQLSGELSQYYDAPLTQAPLLGWNAYVRSSEVSTLTSVSAWFDGATGRAWNVSASIVPVLAEQLGVGSSIQVLPTSDDLTTCAQLQGAFLGAIPLSSTQYIQAGDLSALEACGSAGLQGLSQEFGRMYYLTSADASATARVGVDANSTGLVYGVRGNAPGGALLVWFSNPTIATVGITLTVNESGSAFQSWDAIDASTLGTEELSGPLVRATVSVPPMQWLPLYLEPVRGELLSSYYTATLLREFTYPAQSVYYLEGATNQTVTMAVQSTTPVLAVGFDDRTNLTQLTSAGALLATPSSAGWYYDDTTHLLLVRYASQGADSLRVLQTTPTVASTALPIKTIEFLVAAFIIVDVGLTSYLLVSRQQRRKGQKKDGGP